MNVKHTPGPRCSECSWIDESDSVAKTSFRGVGLCPLHAAAPRLLRALERIAYEPQGHPEASHSEVLSAVVNIAREAIAKAEAEKTVRP